MPVKDHYLDSVILLICVDLLINAIKYDESFHKPCNKRRYTEYEITYSLKKRLV